MSVGFWTFSVFFGGGWWWLLLLLLLDFLQVMCLQLLNISEGYVSSIDLSQHQHRMQSSSPLLGLPLFAHFVGNVRSIPLNILA